MGWPAAIAAVVGSLLNKPSSQERALTSAGTEAAQADAERTRARNEREKRVEEIIRQLAGGGAPPVFRLSPQQGSSDIEEFMAQIAPRGELNAMLQLLGASAGSTGAAQTGLNAGLDLQQRRQQESQEFLDNLVMALISSFGKGREK